MANLEVIALDTVTPQLKAPQAGDGYVMPRPVTVTEVVGSTALTLTGATQTTAVPVLDATQTWNNAAVTFTGLKFNETDTASNAASLLMDLQVGASSKFKIEKGLSLKSLTISGTTIDTNNGVLLTAGIKQGGIALTRTGFVGYRGTATAQVFEVDGVTGVWTASVYPFGWSSTGGTENSKDLTIYRDAADTLAQRRTTNAQTFRVYKSYTDASNYSRLAINNNQIASEVLGTGSLAITADTPLLNLAQTWNNAAVTFTGAKINITDTASNAASLLLDLQGNGASKFTVNKLGTLSAVGDAKGGNLVVANIGGYIGLRNANTFITSPNFHKIQFGNNDAASPAAQTLSVQSVVAGTSNTAGQNFTVRGSQGTGTGVGGDIIFQVAPAGSTGTAQNALAQAMRIYNNKTVAVGSAYTVATLPAAGTQGRRAWVTDATAPTFLGALIGGGTVVCPVFDDGTAWVAG